MTSAVRAQRETRCRHQAIQTEWLLDAGIKRAISQMTADEKYEGEHWIPAFETTQFAKAAVEITVEPTTRSDSSANVVSVNVVATLARSVASPAMEIATRTQKSFTFQISKPTPHSPSINEE
ncbi:hypothetical protein RMSM_01177 [Rhodopirellula maiorica SM1]|uniref:Uncharacterized protein n=1 Tax=Rhodopirellula maiorica SM1 TaxID=1265738 RepID=M5RRD2_9BACT|nr:hypothetical protein RMSM_01177 [Rhodopirellula maiorica SM1]